MKAKLRVTLIALVALGLAAGPAAAKEKKILLKVPIAFSTALPGLGSTILWVAERLDAASGGTLKMKVYEPGKLVAPFEILDAVSTGKVNAGYAAAGYWTGKIPAAPLFSAVPFGPEAGEYLAWMYYGNGLKLYQEMYDQAGYHVKVLPVALLAPETSGWFRKEIKGPEDLKGLRIRFYGLGGKVMEKLGASVSVLPGGEIFPALEKGALDATEFSMPAIDKRLGFYKIAKYNYFPGWHQQSTILELLINKKVWDSMSKHQQTVLDIIARASMLDSFAYGEAIQFAVMKENVQKHGVHLKYWSKEMLDLYRKTWNEVAEEEAAKDPFFAKVWNDLQNFRKDYKVWQAYAFLPRPKPDEVEIK